MVDGISNDLPPNNGWYSRPSLSQQGKLQPPVGGFETGEEPPPQESPIFRQPKRRHSALVRGDVEVLGY